MQLGVDVLRQFASYCVAGGAAAATHLAVLIALIELGGVDKMAASAIGFSCSIPVNYLLQHRFVFARRGRHLTYFSRYLAVTLIGLGLNSALFWVGTNVIGAHYLPTQIVVIGIVVAFNFLVNRTFTFGEPQKRS